MAEGKKGVSKSTQRKKSGSAGRGRKPASPTNNSSKSRKTASGDAVGREKLNGRVKDEIVAAVAIAVGIFLIIAFQTSVAGALGTGLSMFFKGLFGFAAYILPYYFILYGILLFSKKMIKVGVKSIVLLVIIFLMFSLINSGRFIDNNGEGALLGNLTAFYHNGMALDDGGLFGMLAGGIIAKLVGVPGLYILSIVVVFVCALMIMNTPVSRFMENVKEKKAARKADREERQRAREMEMDQLRRRAGAEKIMEENDSVETNYYNDEYQTDEELSAGQKKIIGYMSSTSDFGRSDTSKTPAKKAAKNEAKEKPSPAESLGPIIVGGFSPKDMEEKLTKAEASKITLQEEDFNASGTTGADYVLPSVDLLKKPDNGADKQIDEAFLRERAEKLESTLKSFNIDARVTNVTKGPAVTRYEVHPNSGVKVKGIKNLSDDIALNMEAKSIRIEAPIPGKPAVGIEIENDRINMVTIREIIDSLAFKKAESKISFAVGKDIAGNSIVGDLKAMPHLLIAGSTGSGKSVCVNSIITSILYKATPEEVKFVLIDPKVVELANYNGIPHMLIPVVTEPTKAAAALNWAVAEMDDRYRKFAEEGVRELASYNNTMRKKEMPEEVMPQVVIIIDELADLMMAAPAQVEESICRLAQKARAAGMHLIVATQRPSVDVITGVIKANIPSRIAFAVSSQFDSRTILDMAGAEKLVGKGDMLFNPLGSGKPVRVQGTFISDSEVHDVIEYVKSQVQEIEYSEGVMDTIERANVSVNNTGDRGNEDELLPEAIELVVNAGQASVSMLQRRFRIGYNRAARIIDMMEERQIVGPADGSRPRQVLITEEEMESMDETVKDLEV